MRTLQPSNPHIYSLTFSPDGKILACGGDGKVTLWRVSDGFLVRTFEGIFANSVAFSPDGKILASGGDKTIKVWRVSDGFLIRELEGKLIASVAFSPSGDILASGGNDIKLWRVSDWSLVAILEKEFVNSIIFSPDGRILVSGGEGGMAKVWDPRYGKLLASLFAFGPDTSVSFNPEGFFAGIGDFNRYVHFVKGLEVYDFNQFYDAFYRPDLVEKKLRGEDISKYTGGLNIEEAIKKPPPKVSILSPKKGDTLSSRTVTLKVQIQDTGGEIGDIRVHHNGKLVDSLGVYRLTKPEPDDKRMELAKADIESPYQTTKRGTVLRRVWEDKERKETKIVDFNPLKGTVEKVYTITLIKGDNTISVSAFNGTNTVMSAMESIRIKADVPERKPEVFILSIGNNNFANSSYNLKMAIKDVKDFSDSIKKVAAPLYEKINVQTLIDAKKGSVIETINSMKNQIKPGDVFIFFAATHGRAEDDLYYLYTSGFDGDYRNPKTFISSVELMELSKKIPALKQVFILDTCQAGGVEAIVSGLYDARISVLAKALGMHIFAGSKTYQEAQDDYKANGLFTHFVLNGLKGKADQNRDKEVTVFEMNPYLSSAVKEASQGKQEPFIRNFGDDLPISRFIDQ